VYVSGLIFRNVILKRLEIMLSQNPG